MKIFLGEVGDVSIRFAIGYQKAVGKEIFSPNKINLFVHVLYL
jgi:hypothetical protein